MIDTVSQKFFEQKYSKDPDPWKFASSGYEQGRYNAIYSVLSHRRYSRAFEAGCSIGILTKQLAPLCDCLQAVDIAPTAVAFARKLCKHLPQVTVTCGTLPEAIPKGSFDLIVLSEICYYFTEAQLFELAGRLVNQVQSSGILLAAHWLGHSQDHILSGDRVHNILRSLGGLALEYEERQESFRLDCWRHV